MSPINLSKMGAGRDKSLTHSMEEQIGVEASQSAPSGEAVETTTENAATVDEWAAKYAELFEENERLARDRDNYKKGMLSAKKGGVDGAEIDRLVEEKVSSKLQELEITKHREEEKAFVQKLMRENKELKLAVQNKPADTPAGSSASSERDEASVAPKFSKEQMAYLKEKRGFTDKDIETLWKNYQKRG